MMSKYHIRKTGDIEGTVKKYQYHPSISNTKDIMKSKYISYFRFQPVSVDRVKNIIKTLNTLKRLVRTAMYI